MSAQVKLLLILMDETDTYEDVPLYEAIVKRLRQLDISGATVHTGIMGFGSHGKLHRKGLFGISDDRPVTIMVADSEENIRKVLPEIREMVEEGLFLLVDVEMIPLKPTRPCQRLTLLHRSFSNLTWRQPPPSRRIISRISPVNAAD